MARYGADILIKGQSGQEYIFELWEIDSYWAKVPAVYVFTRKHYNKKGMGVYPVIFCGETANLRECLSNNQIIEFYKKEGARLLCIRRETSSAIREEIATDISLSISQPQLETVNKLVS